MLRLDGKRLPVRRWWRPAKPRLPALRRRLRDDVVSQTCRQWRSSLGRGEGLTPYADDVLCGTLATMQAAGHPQAGPLAREIAAAPLEELTTAASAGLLRQAAAGWCLDEVAAVLTAHTTRGGLTAALACLEQIGHSSGSGLSEGIHNVLRGAARQATA